MVTHTAPITNVKEVFGTVCLIALSSDIAAFQSFCKRITYKYFLIYLLSETFTIGFKAFSSYKTNTHTLFGLVL